MNNYSQSILGDNSLQKEAYDKELDTEDSQQARNGFSKEDSTCDCSEYDPEFIKNTFLCDGCFHLH
jgi:hypothetical protein